METMDELETKVADITIPTDQGIITVIEILDERTFPCCLCDFYDPNIQCSATFSCNEVAKKANISRYLHTFLTIQKHER